MTAPSPVSLREHVLSVGAVLADDGIPLHFGDLAAEIAAVSGAILLDRSHEGRLVLTGRDALTLLNRTSTNDITRLTIDRGAGTIFTSPTGRVIDRVHVVRRAGDVLILTEPGRGAAVQGYLQRNIFFNDDVQIRDLSRETHAFALHGHTADRVLAANDAALTAAPDGAGHTLTIAGAAVYAARLRPLHGAAWAVIVPVDAAAAVWTALTAAGARSAGSLAYNALRIQAGRPGIGRELTGDYIPLELGLWDEVSFTKGCYTGQEIIARMESRGKLAKTIVRVTLNRPVTAPQPLMLDDKSAGTLTSAVQTPDGDTYGIAVVKLAAAVVGAVLTLPDGATAQITALAGVQPSA